MMQPPGEIHFPRPVGPRAPFPPESLTCPRCGAGATPSPTVQTCGLCKGAFTLRAGALLDPTTPPPPVDPRLPRVVVKSAGIVLMRQGVLAAEGVLEGTLDPFVALIPMDQAGIRYGDIVSVAVWRKIDVLRLVVALVIPVPLTLLLLYAAVASAAAFLIGALPFALISAYMLYRSLGLQAHMMRVAGSTRVLTIRFDSPLWRRRQFHDELLRRAGISSAPIP